MERLTLREWQAKVGWLPPLIDHVAFDLYCEGRAPANAVAEAIRTLEPVAKKGRNSMGGRVPYRTQHALQRALAEFEREAKPDTAQHRSSTNGSASLLKAVNRLRYVIQPMSQTGTFSLRYGHRLAMVEGLLHSLSGSRPLSVKTAAQLLEAPETTPVGDLAEQLADRKAVCLMLMEALGYGSQPIRARTGPNKGKFHGMHGVERAAKKRDLLHERPEEDHPVLAMMGREQNEELIAEAAPTLAPAPTSAAFEQLHPRAAHGQFGSKGGEHAAAAGGADAGQASALADAIRQADPAFRAAYGETSAFAAANPTSATQTPVNVAAQQIQAVGYDNSPSGISQFQKDEGLPITGKLDDTTLATVQTVYSQNTRYAAARVPDFTGIAGAGARATSTRRSVGGVAGRTTKGKTSAKKINESTFGFDSPLFRPNFDPNDENGDDRQPGGDDFDLDETPNLPPGLREAEGVVRCKTCPHFSPKGWVTRRGVHGACLLHTYPVDSGDTCDDWMTLTPPDAHLRVYEARLAEAQESGDSLRIVSARAALKALRDRSPGGAVVEEHPASEWLFEALYALRIEERDISPEKRAELAKKGQTLKRSQSYPIASLGDLGNAIQAFGRSKPADRPALKRLLSKMARKLGASADVKQRIAALSEGYAELVALDPPTESAVLREAADSMVKATVHEPVGKPGGPGLWKHKGLELPAYIQHIANDIREKRGIDTSHAIAIAIAAVKKWARGGGKVDAGTRAAAAKAVAEWERLKATH